MRWLVPQASNPSQRGYYFVDLTATVERFKPFGQHSDRPLAFPLDNAVTTIVELEWLDIAVEKILRHVLDNHLVEDLDKCVEFVQGRNEQEGKAHRAFVEFVAEEPRFAHQSAKLINNRNLREHSAKNR